MTFDELMQKMDLPRNKVAEVQTRAMQKGWNEGLIEALNILAHPTTRDIEQAYNKIHGRLVK